MILPKKFNLPPHKNRIFIFPFSYLCFYAYYCTIYISVPILVIWNSINKLFSQNFKSFSEATLKCHQNYGRSAEFVVIFIIRGCDVKVLSFFFIFQKTKNYITTQNNLQNASPHNFTVIINPHFLTPPSHIALNQPWNFNYHPPS